MQIHRTILLGLLLLITFTASFAATDETDANVCNKFSVTKAKLNHIYDEYSLLPKRSENAEKFFLLDRQLELAIKTAQKMYTGDSDQYIAISNCLWDGKYHEMGLSIGHYTDQIEYSQNLMVEAHQLNPHSKYRSYTLYTEIYGKSADHNFPDVDTAILYLKEFPNGPYATDVIGILAGFYHDLYAALRNIKEEPNIENRSETYSCFDDYIAQHPKDANIEGARKLGILYFEKILAAIPLKNPYYSMYLDELDALKHGKTDNTVNSCGD